MIKAALFDLDDTLYDHQTFIEGAYRVVAEDVASHLSLPAEDVFVHMWEKFTSRTTSDHTIFSQALQDYDHYSEDLENAMVDSYRTHSPDHLDSYEGIPEALGRLKKKGILLGLLSDGPSTVQRNKLMALKITTLFDTVVITGDFGRDYYKPHPRGFEAACTGLGLPEAEVIMIGDNPLTDIAGAQNMGMQAIRIRSGRHASQPVANDIPEFPTALEAVAFLETQLETQAI